VNQDPREMSPSASTSDQAVAPARSVRDRLATALLAAGAEWSADRHAALDMRAPAIVFAPHPDDEVLGCGGTIALKALAGASVRVVIMTDGRTSHAQFVDAQTLIDMRRSEAVDAARQLGLDPSTYTFLDFEDNHLGEYAVQARKRVAELLQQHRPAQVFVPHRRDHLRDHVATYEIVSSAIHDYGLAMTLLEYPVWLWNSWPWTNTLPGLRGLLAGVPRMLRDGAELAFGCRTRIDVRSVLSRKLDALAQYRSQVERQGGDSRWPILSDVSQGSFLQRFRAGTEVFRRSQLGVEQTRLQQ
jgi:LmbE family N-acetylglucosaminyl deacetylase